MRRTSLLALFTVAVVALAAGLACLSARPAVAKEVSISVVVVGAEVRPNGDLRVRENRVLSFSGQFSFVYWDLSSQGSDGIVITGASGPETGGTGSVPYTLAEDDSSNTPGTYSVVDSGGGVRVVLHFRVADATAQFQIDYVARGAAKRWEDTAELYWKFVGDEAQIPSEDVRVTVRLPDGVGRDQVRAWAHGPLWGDVAIEPDASLVLRVSPLPASTYVEGRILFPADALAKAPLAGGAREQAVLAEEQELADEANRTRLVARVKVVLWSIVGFGVPLLALALVAWLYFRHGREPKARFRAEYLRDLPQPSLPPALVSYIWRMGNVARDDVSATLLDLVNRKVIDMERVTVHKPRLLAKDDTVSYRLTLHDERLAGLLPHERDLLEFLFRQIAEGPTFVLSELKDLAKEKRTEFAKGYSGWMATVKSEGARRRYLEPHATRMAWIGAGSAVAGFAAAVAAAVFTGWLWFLVGVPLCVALLFLARAIKRRSPEAAELHAQYAALERYLKDFGRLQEKPPDAVVLWEHFLVYAVVFGIADQVVKAMAVKAPEVVNDPAFAPSYLIWFAAPGDAGGVSAFSALHEDFGAAVSVATSSSSGSGGGGGFSGGGGGGGGGGGFGAG